MSTPIDDRPAHKGYPHRLNRPGSLIAELFGVPESLMAPVPYQMMPLVSDLSIAKRVESAKREVIREFALDEIDPHICPRCLGDACEYGCGSRNKDGACHRASTGTYGPDVHRICHRCCGTGRENP